MFLMLDVLLVIVVLDSGLDFEVVVVILVGDGVLIFMELGINVVVEVKEFGVFDEVCWIDVVTVDLRLRGVVILILGVFFGVVGSFFF